MREHIRQKMIEALESGTFLYGRNALKYRDRSGQVRHCVGGVLCELYEQSTKSRRGKFIEVPMEELEGIPDETYENIRAIGGKSIFSIVGHINRPPPRILEWAGIGDPEMQLLLGMNDQVEPFGHVVQHLKESQK
jgi:hypothetical protein